MNSFIEFMKIRGKNPQFYVRIILISFLPILSYFGLSSADLSSWAGLGNVLYEFISNPYLLGLYILTIYQSFKNTGDKEVK